MPIPGKYCFGILEEDNPLKSYFRFKPLLVEIEGRYEPFAEGEAYPEDGCIRIVPDKNESSRFKARMRRMGRYAVVDLRNHPGENDKIRPNKNYRGDGSEQNAHIIYSDVVQGPLAGSVLEILTLDVPEDSTHMALTLELPATRHVLVRGSDGALNPYVWRCEAMENIEGGVSLSRTDLLFEHPDAAQFDIDGFRGEALHFALALPGERLLEVEEEPETEAQQPAPAAVTATPKEEEPAAPERSGEDAPEQTPVSDRNSDRNIEEAPAAARPEPAKAPVRPEPPMPEPPRPPRGAGRMSPADHAMMLQSGLNPRRGRSLQEVIEDKWRHSRLDQLGHPVPGEATGQPVVSPVERAVFAMREAWAQPEARPALCSALTNIDGLTLDAAPEKASPQETALSQELNELEAQRLRLLDEISTLKAGRIETHEKIVEEIRTSNARLFAEGEEKLAAQRAELERLQAQVEEASTARQAAETALADLRAETEKRIGEFAVTSRAARLAARLNAYGAPVVIGTAKAETLSAGELISTVRGCFERAGQPLTNDEAVNLLACVALSPATVLSGPAGSGKSATAARLASALGLNRAGRCLRLTPSRRPIEENEAYRELTACVDCAAPVFALVDDVNANPGEAAVYALLAHMEQPGANPALRLLATAQDAPFGAPLSARLLDRAFVVRLQGEAADTDWAPRPCRSAEAELTVSEETLCAVFADESYTVSDAAQQRLQALRVALGAYGMRLSRRTLNAMWRYCAAGEKLMQRDALAVLDLAIAQRALPVILATAPLEALHRLPELLKDLPVSLKLLSQPLPLEI